MAELLEHKWSAVKLGSNNHYAVTSQQGDQSSANASWYNKYVTNDGDRRTRLHRYDGMDRDSVEIGRALDIIAEDISACNADEEDTIILDFEESGKILKTHIKLLEAYKDHWLDRTGLDEDFYDICRQYVKYGGVFFIKCPDGKLKRIRPERLVGYILSEDDDTVVSHYLIDVEAPHLNLLENSRRAETIQTTRRPSSAQDRIQHVSVEDMVILKRGPTPFGESILERVFGVWRKLQLLENAVVIYRVVRAPEKRAFYIDVGRLPAKKHPEVIRHYKSQMKQKKVLDSNGNLDTDFDPHSTTEDFYLPVTSQGRSSRIEPLQGGQQLGELSDLTYYARKLAAGLRIPPSMTDTQNEQNDRESYSDMRVGQVYQVEMRYMGFITRDQRKVAKELRRNFEWFCEEREVEVPVEMGFRIAAAHNFALYKDIELNQSLLNVFQSTTQIQTLSQRFAMGRYLNMSKEDLIDNELKMLEEKGLHPDQIKEMPEETIANIVYGDGRLGKDFGLAPDDGGMRF